MPRLIAVLLAALIAAPGAAWAQHWSTVWAGSAQGPYPSGLTVAAPDLGPAFPKPELGAHEQTFRLMVKPDLFGAKMRFRLSNVFGSKPVTFDTAFVGLQMSGAAVVPGTNRPLTFAGKPAATVAPGGQVWSDPVALPFVHDPASPELAGRRLAVSFHVAGDSGPMTWHATAMTTSYVTAPGAGAVGELEEEDAYAFSTTSWFFLDAVDAATPAGTRVVVALGDSLTDGVNSTLNGDDRWPDVLSRRIHAAQPGKVVVVNAGINGNQLLGPAGYAADRPFAGGPSATARLDRDVLGLSGVTHVVLLAGMNDMDVASAAPTAVRDGMQALVARLHKPGLRVIGATLPSSRGAKVAAFGLSDADDKRRGLNDMVRRADLFDAVVDFDAATLDPQTGELRAELVPNSTVGGPGDKLHPNRAGYLAMGNAVDLALLDVASRPRGRPRPAARPAATPAPTGLPAAQ